MKDTSHMPQTVMAWKEKPVADAPAAGSDVSEGVVSDIQAGSQHLHRKLRSKEVQLFAIGGAIGTCEYSPPDALSTDSL